MLIDQLIDAAYRPDYQIDCSQCLLPVSDSTSKEAVAQKAIDEGWVVNKNGDALCGYCSYMVKNEER